MSQAAPSAGSARRTLLVGAGFFALSYLAAELGYAIQLHPSQVVLVWPPSGIMLGALLLVDRHDWRAALTGAFLANVPADLAHSGTFALAVTGGLVNTVEHYVAGLAVLRVSGRTQVRMTSLREVNALIFGAAIGANAVTAMFGAIVLASYYPTSFLQGWLTWWTGDGLAMMTLTPAILIAADWWERRRQVSWRRVAEHTAFAAAAALLVVLTLASKEGLSQVAGHDGRTFFVVPLLVAAGLRLGPSGAAVATLTVTISAVAYAVTGDFAVVASVGAWHAELLDVYTFIAVSAVSALIPAAAIADRARTERALRQVEERFRLIADNTAEAFLLAEVPSGRPVYVSPSWSTIWGRPLAEGYDAANIVAAIRPDDMPRVRLGAQATMGGEPADVQFRIARPDGTERWLRARSFPARDDDGHVTHLVALIEDATQLRDAERRFTQAQKLDAVGRLAGGVAHDFNNLLTTISAEAQLLEEAAVPAPHDASVAAIRHAVESGAALTRQLLTFSRREPAAPQPIELNATVQDLTRMLTRLLGRAVGLDVRLADAPAWIRADRTQVEQVLLNLVVNARDAMPTGGFVQVVVELVAAPPAMDHEEGRMNGDAPMGWAGVSVRDTGTGMPEAVVAHAFEPFFTTKPMGRGTGLGLSTCMQIVVEAGGRIGITSKPGVGTTVRALFPLMEPPESGAPRANS
ncbi:MAG: MASE1 domain-containing protein [Gemmatimonadota bacterium]|nr:MASE1 domain-containing protein [Gemmatimonadota bacterium]